MAEMENNLGRIFMNYIRPTKKGDKINVPVHNGQGFVNVILSKGMAIDLVCALQENIEKIDRKEVNLVP